MKNNPDFNYLLKRGVSEIIIEAEMTALLYSGKKLRLKEGFDPSFPDIHLGHMVTLRKLRHFQELGHQVVLIVGDWTAQIGDPSGASITRPMLSAEQVKANAETYMQQFFKIVDKEKTEVRWQSEWFGKFTLSDIIQLTSKFTVAQMLAREDFSNRYNSGRPIAVTELLYPLLQAYDSVAIRADVEFGGTDQKFNLLVGRELQEAAGMTPQQLFLVPLLVGTDGSQKMSKSLGNYIGVAEPPEEIYGKVMSIPDNLVPDYFELLTDVPDKELAELKQQLDSAATNPMVIKKRLAREIIGQLYDQEAAAGAEEHFARVVQKKEAPSIMPEFSFPFSEVAGQLAEKGNEASRCKSTFNVFDSEVIRSGDDSNVFDISRIIVHTEQAKSRSEALRLINNGAVSINGQKISGNLAKVTSGSIIQVGKRRFVKVTNTA
ncbi:tyrosine--tRNA ligase [Chloroflexota bacterium]